MTVVSQHFQGSESVALDEFGTFRIVMKSGGKGVETIDKVSAVQSSLTVRFLPCFTRNLDGTTATRSLVTGAKCVRFDPETSASSGENEPEGGGGSEGGGSEAPDPIG